MTHTTEQIPSINTPASGDHAGSGDGAGKAPLQNGVPADSAAGAGAAGAGGDDGAVPASGSARAASLDRTAKRSLFERAEAYVSRLSSKNNFWHRLTSLIWLPYAFRSGIKMKRISGETFEAVLPFRRFNRNWYNAMAGAALLGNAEIAGGMYVFGICGGDYTVVCKHLEYKFLRPCFGPARYRITPRDDIHALVQQGGEFNITVTLDIQQQLNKPGEKAKRVGRANATFHVTPKLHHKQKKITRAAKTA